MQPDSPHIMALEVVLLTYKIDFRYLKKNLSTQAVPELFTPQMSHPYNKIGLIQAFNKDNIMLGGKVPTEFNLRFKLNNAFLAFLHRYS